MAGFTPEEAEAIRQQELEDIQRFGRASDETRKQLMDLSVGVKGTTEGLTRNFKNLGSSGLSLAQELNAGKVGATVFNSSIGSMSSALGDLAGLIPYVGGALKTLIKGAGDYTQAVNTQAEALMSSYRELGAIGAATAGGIEDVYANLKNLNLAATEADLQKFNGLVRENAQTFASFGTTVGSGVKEFTNITNAIHNEVGPEFRAMGISIDEVNKGVMSYVKMQTLMGGRQKMTTDQLISASQEYIREVDLLAKITGKNRSEQEASKESAMAEERFAAYRFELQQRAAMGDEAAKAQLKTVDATAAMLDKQAPELRKGFLNVLSGTVDTPEAQKLLLAAPDAFQVAMQKAFTQEAFESALFKNLKSNLAVNADGSRGSALQQGAVGVNNQFSIPLQEQIKLVGFLAKTLAEREAQAVKDAKPTSDITKQQTEMETKNLKSRDQLNDLINVGIGPVTTAMSGAATAAEKTITAFTKMAETFGIQVNPRAATSSAAPNQTDAKTAQPARASNTAMPSDVSKSVAPRPKDPLKGQVWDSKYASGWNPDGSAKNATGALATAGVQVRGSAEAKLSAEKYFGKPISDSEFSALIKATHAEAAGGKKASQQEQAMIMASVLNRARTDQGGVMGALEAKNAFQSVTGTKDAKGPSQQYLQGPENQRLKSIEGATKLLEKISVEQKNFTAADAAAYGPGTKISYRDKMLAAGGTVVGGSVFQTAPPTVGGYKFGGIATGPEEGYETTLHGTEAVVPLPDGRTIPVQMQGADQQMGIMAAQLARLDDIMRVMQNQLGVSEKILKYAQ